MRIITILAWPQLTALSKPGAYWKPYISYAPASPVYASAPVKRDGYYRT